MLEQIKLFLGITDTSRDELLTFIVNNATARLQNLLSGIEPPEELEYIIVDVSVGRYNRIGSESMASHTVEGEAITFIDDDFKEYTDDINAWLERQAESTRGKLRFI